MSDTHQTIVTIRNKLGLHARPAMALVDLTNQFESDVALQRDDSSETIDGKSIMQVMMLAATKGTRLKVVATGPDAQKLVLAITEIVNRGFDEE